MEADRYGAAGTSKYNYNNLNKDISIKTIIIVIELKLEANI